MALKNDLFELIKSLNKTEKAYFKRNFHKNKKDKDNPYLKLFDIIDSQEVYEEDKVLKRIKGKFTKQNISSAKNYLYKQLNATMASYESLDNSENEIWEHFLTGKFLLKKGLYDQGLQAVKKGIEKAQTNESFELLLRLQNLKDELLHQSQKIEEIEAFEANEVDHALSTIQQLENYWLLRRRCIQYFLIIHGDLVQRSEDQEKAIKEIIEDPLMTSPDQALSLKARSMVLYVLIKYYRMRDSSKSLALRKEHVDLIERNMSSLNYSEVTHLRVLANLLNGLIESKQIDEFKQVLNRYKSLQVKSENNRVLQIATILVHEVGLVHAQLPQNGVSELENIAKRYEEYKNKLSTLDKIIINHNIAVGFIYYDETNKALNHVVNVIDINDPKILLDAQSYARILNVLLHVELGNIEHAQSAARSAYRYLSKTDHLFESDKAVLRFVRATEKVRSKNEKTDLLKKLLSELKEMKNREPAHAPVFAYFDIIPYLRSKIEGKKMRELYKNQTEN